MADATNKQRDVVGLLVLVLSACVLYGAFVGYAVSSIASFTLDVGSIHEPTRGFLRLAACLTCIGIPLSFTTYRLLARASVFSNEDGFIAEWQAMPPRTAAFVLAGFATSVSIALRFSLLQDNPLTDDESSYLFAAQLIASGRISAPSPAMPVFFDNAFLINDGSMYSPYFLGWPSLLAIGVSLGIPWIVNPLLHGATTLLVMGVARERWGSSYAMVAGLFYVSSLFAHVGAATQMSHASSTCMLACLTYAVTLTSRDRVSVLVSTAVGASFGAAFLIRPATAVGFGGPLLISWAWSLRFRSRSLSHLAACSSILALTALGFLLLNAKLTGSPWHTGYHAGLQHAVDTAYRFVHFGPGSVDADKFLFFFVDFSAARMLAKYAVVLIRFWVDAHGYPIGLALALAAAPRDTRFFLGPVLGLMLAHIPLPDAGIDSFGPVHYSELILSITWLSTSGARCLFRFAHRIGRRADVPRFLVANAIVGLSIYAPLRISTLAAIVEDIGAPRAAFERAPEQSIVFYRRPFARPCAGLPARHHVLFRPNNHPDLEASRLWANHISLTRDRELLASMPGRKGYLLIFHATSCKYEIVPLESAREADAPQVVQELPGDFDVEKR